MYFGDGEKSSKVRGDVGNGNIHVREKYSEEAICWPISRSGHVLKITNTTSS